MTKIILNFKKLNKENLKNIMKKKNKKSHLEQEKKLEWEIKVQEIRKII